MPYISVRLSKEITPHIEEKIKAGLGRDITAIPGKTEERLMVDIQDKASLFLAGERKTNAAYVDIRLYGSCEFEPKAELTKKVYSLFKEILDMKETDMYVTIREFETWGAGGAIK